MLEINEINEINEIKARAESATAGSWEHNMPYVDVKKSEYVRSAICVVGMCEQNKLDAEFITHARQDIPKLIAEIERLSVHLKEEEEDEEDE